MAEGRIPTVSLNLLDPVTTVLPVIRPGEGKITTSEAQCDGLHPTGGRYILRCNLLQDLCYAMRSFAKTPGFTALIVLSLADALRTE